LGNKGQGRIILNLGNELVDVKTVDGVDVDVIGCWDGDTPEGEYDFYDLYMEGECINEGEPCYDLPTDEDIRAHLELRRELLKGC